MDKLAAKLTRGKFICGDKMTVFDFLLAPYFTDRILNPNNRGKPHWDTAWAVAPDRVKQYITDFQGEISEHLANRPESKMGI